MEISIETNSFQLAQVFTISRGSRTQADVLTVTLSRGISRGRGECVPYARYGESMESVSVQIQTLPQKFDRQSLMQLLPAGAARNAVDCALWDLEAKEADCSAWELAGISLPKPVITAYTLSLDTPEKMNEQAAKNSFRPLLKTKLGGGDGDVDRIRAVRAGALNSRIIVDANDVNKIKKKFSKKYMPYEIGFISKGSEKLKLFNKLMEILKNPYQVNDDNLNFMSPASQSDKKYQTYCGT